MSNTAIATIPMNELSKMANAIASSGLFGVKTEAQALGLMLVAQAQGISPATACVDFDLIQGKPAMTARAMLSRFQQAGGVIRWLKYTDEVCEASFTHPQCPDSITIKWTMEDARRAGLSGKDNWKKWPRQMLSSRVMSEGVDRCYPAASGGFYPPEVVQDFTPEKNITPTSGAAERVEPEKIGEIDALAVKMQEFCTAGQYEDAVLEAENAALDADQMTYLWTQFDSATRRELKKASKAIKERYSAQVVEVAPEQSTAIIDSATDDKISDAQRKRIEAIISKHKLNREDLKLKCSETWNAASFADLTKEQYKEFDEYIQGIIEFANPTEAI